MGLQAAAGAGLVTKTHPQEGVGCCAPAIHSCCWKKTCVLQERKGETQNILCKPDGVMESGHFRQLVDSCVVESVRQCS